jgi:hypothetical protein
MRTVNSSVLSIPIFICLGFFCPISAQVLKLEPGQKEPSFIHPSMKTDAHDPSKFLFYPQPETDDAFRYRFWIPASERKPGSAAGRVLRAFIEYNQAASNRSRDFWRDAPSPVSYLASEEPLSSLDVSRSRGFLRHFKATLDELYAAIDLEDFDTVVRLQDLNGKEALELRLEEMSVARAVARILVIDIRLAVAESRYDDAVKSLQAGFKLAEVVEKSWPGTLVPYLVSNAIVPMMLDRVQEMMQQPDCPNLYWALATLPNQFGDIREVLLNEDQFIRKIAEYWKELPEKQASPEAWRERFSEVFSRVVADYSNEAWQSEELLKVQAGVCVLLYAEPSRSFLKDSGWAYDTVEAMSDSEAVLRATYAQLDQKLRQASRWNLLPSEIMIQPQYSQLLGNAKPDGASFASFVYWLFAPTSQTIKRVGLRTETLKNRLITIAALQAWANENPGKEFPSDLSGLFPLPAWPDAYTRDNFTLERPNAGEFAIIFSKNLTPGPWGRIRLVRPAPK